MEYGIIKETIIGKFNTYTKLTALNGYCFYDVDAEDRNYMTSIVTPILDEEELKRKYIIVFGNAERLNEESQQEEI